MELSVIIPLYGFQHQREVALQTLYKNIELQNLRIRGNDGQLTEIRDFEAIVTEQACEQGTHVVPIKPYLKHITLPAQNKGFNKSWCMNVAAKTASTDNLVFLDVDMSFDENYFSRIKAHKNELRYFTCWSYIIQHPGKDNPKFRTITSDTTHTSGGCFFVRRNFFWELGGMNENYFGYGGEDNDLWIRVNRALGPLENLNIPWMGYTLNHAYHDWAPPSPDRFFHLNRTNQHTLEVIKRLRAVQLGNPAEPTPIDISDLSLPEAGMEDGGKGFLGK